VGELRRIGVGSVDWIHMAHDRDCSQSIVKMTVNLTAFGQEGNIFIICCSTGELLNSLKVIMPFCGIAKKTARRAIDLWAQSKARMAWKNIHQVKDLRRNYLTSLRIN
jgi:hypothetical protein